MDSTGCESWGATHPLGGGGEVNALEQRGVEGRFRGLGALAFVRWATGGRLSYAEASGDRPPYAEASGDRPGGLREWLPPPTWFRKLLAGLTH